MMQLLLLMCGERRCRHTQRQIICDGMHVVTMGIIPVLSAGVTWHGHDLIHRYVWCICGNARVARLLLEFLQLC